MLLSEAYFSGAYLEATISAELILLFIFLDGVDNIFPESTLDDTEFDTLVLFVFCE